MPRNLTDEIEIALKGTVAQFQDLVTFMDRQGVHCVVRPFLDQIMQQGNAEAEASNIGNGQAMSQTTIASEPDHVLENRR